MIERPDRTWASRLGYLNLCIEMCERRASDLAECKAPRLISERANLLQEMDAYREMRDRILRRLAPATKPQESAI